MYQIDLPEQGCNVFYGTYVDNYFNSVRTRYYLNDGRLVRSSTSSYTRVPDGSVCLSTGDLVYKPETQVYFQFLAILSVLVIIGFAVKFMLHRFWRR